MNQNIPWSPCIHYIQYTIKLTTTITQLSINTSTNNLYMSQEMCLEGLPSHFSRPSYGDCHSSPPHGLLLCSPISEKICFLKHY